jgi:hypothetical protein
VLPYLGGQRNKSSRGRRWLRVSDRGRAGAWCPDRHDPRASRRGTVRGQEAGVRRLRRSSDARRRLGERDLILDFARYLASPPPETRGAPLTSPDFDRGIPGAQSSNPGTASRARGSSPRTLRIVAATCAVSTKLVTDRECRWTASSVLVPGFSHKRRNVVLGRPDLVQL